MPQQLDYCIKKLLSKGQARTKIMEDTRPVKDEITEGVNDEHNFPTQSPTVMHHMDPFFP